jgi:hypothetical protein
MTANIFVLNYKHDGVIRAYAELANIPLREAFDVFYKSNLESVYVNIDKAVC